MGRIVEDGVEGVYGADIFAGVDPGGGSLAQKADGESARGGETLAAGERETGSSRRGIRLVYGIEGGGFYCGHGRCAGFFRRSPDAVVAFDTLALRKLARRASLWCSPR